VRRADAAAYEGERRFGLDRDGVEEALPVLAAQCFESRVLLLGLDAFGDDVEPERAGDVDDAARVILGL